MPRIYLSFNADTEREDFEAAFAGAEYKYAIEDISNWLRNIVKYDPKLKDVERRVYQEVREKMVEILKQRGLL